MAPLLMALAPAFMDFMDFMGGNILRAEDRNEKLRLVKVLVTAPEPK